MSLLQVARALETRLNAMDPALPTCWENLPFTIPDGPYQRADWLPAPPDNPTFGGTPAFYRERGIFQVTIFYSPTGGALDARTKAEAIRDWFARGASYTSGSVTVKIMGTPAISPQIPDPTRYVLAISIRYSADIN